MDRVSSAGFSQGLGPLSPSRGDRRVIDTATWNELWEALTRAPSTVRREFCARNGAIYALRQRVSQPGLLPRYFVSVDGEEVELPIEVLRDWVEDAGRTPHPCMVRQLVPA